jgi:alginate O-acetyltransferase complex protein AlgJ
VAQPAWEEDKDLYPRLSRFIRDGKVVRGKGGWLFLANDTYAVMSQHAGERTLSSNQIQGWQALLEERTAKLAEQKAQYFFLVSPHPHGVYPEMLPDGFVPAPERPVHKLLAHLRQARSPARVIYPLEEMVAEKENRLVCSPVDTHWTEFGALVAYSRLMKEVRDFVPVRELDPARIGFTTRLMPGELRYKLGFEDDVEHLAAVFPVRAQLLEDNQVELFGGRVVLECPDAPPTVCVLFGDSNSPAILPYLAESFRRLVFAHTPWVDYELLERERPDVVISLLAERFLIQVPEEANAPSFDELTRARAAKGLFRPRMPMWDDSLSGAPAHESPSDLS